MPPPVPLLLLWTLCASSARAGSHSHRVFYSALSEGLPGAPQFSAVGYMDDEPIEAYSSWSRRLEPRAPWMARVVESDPRYWERNTEVAQGEEALRKVDVRTAMGRNNQTTGLHTVQLMYSCELRDDGSIAGFRQYAYDGRDFLSLDLEHMRYTAAMEAARATADRWNEERIDAQYYKAYLEQECIEWLQRYLDYGKEQLLRRVPPQVRISRRSDTVTTLTCYAFGFYPREVEMNWVRNGVTMDWKTKVILPNTDGTYQIRTTVELPEGHDVKDYRCQVDHISLEDIITEVYNEASGTWYIWLIAVIAGVGAIVALIAAVIWKRKHPDKGNNTAANKGVTEYTPMSNNGKAGSCSSPSNSFA